jgi:hypothetical protein
MGAAEGHPRFPLKHGSKIDEWLCSGDGKVEYNDELVVVE